jgi:hypothetical protein
MKLIITKRDIDKALNESNELLSKSKNLLNKFKIDQTQLSTLFESAQLILTNLEQIKDGLQTNMFNESLLKFEKQTSFDSSVIGKIAKQNIELHFLENIQKMRELEDFVSKTKFTLYFPILQPFKTNSFLTVYSYKNILNLLCIDKDGNRLFERKDLIKNKQIKEFKGLNFVSTKNKKTLFICTEERHLKQNNKFFYLRSFDENFNLLAEIKLDKESDEHEVNGENIFLLIKNEKCCTISMYNHNLEMVQKFGQENSILPYFFSLKIDHFMVSNRYFIIIETLIDEVKDDDEYCHRRVTMINRSNGLVEASFKILADSDQIRLYLDKFLITFNRSDCLFKCYNFNGDLLGKITLDKKFTRSDVGVLDKELFFFLDNNRVLIC